MRKHSPKLNTVIDLGGWVAVIDDTGSKPVWKKLERIFATQENAKKVLSKNGYKDGWILSDNGDKIFVQV
jgi:hypothetical protein